MLPPKVRYLRQSALLCALALGSAAPAAHAQGELYVKTVTLSAEEAARRAIQPASARPFEIALANDILRAGNTKRRDHGLDMLRFDQTLALAAQRYSEKMRDLVFFDHVSPDGETLSMRLPVNARPNYSRLGENLWSAEGALDWRPGRIADQAASDWIDSPSHRDNLLEPAYTKSGVGIAIGPDKVYVTMLYARERDQRLFAGYQDVITYDAMTPQGEIRPVPQNPQVIADEAELYLTNGLQDLRAQHAAARLDLDGSLQATARNHARKLLNSGSVHGAGGDVLLQGLLNGGAGQRRQVAMALWQADGITGFPTESLAGSALDSWRQRADTYADLVDQGFNRVGIGAVSDGKRLFVAAILTQEEDAAQVGASLTRRSGANILVVE